MKNLTPTQITTIVFLLAAALLLFILALALHKNKI